MMTEDTSLTGPDSLHQMVEGLGGPLRLETLVTCAYCREGHAGMCLNELVSEGDACPAGWLVDEVERRRMESPDSG